MAMTGWAAWALLAAQPMRFDFVEAHMGGEVSIRLYAPERGIAERAARAAFDRFAALEQTASDYRPASELNRLCDAAGEWRRISPDLERLLRQSVRMERLSAGAFRITARPVIGLWREARQTGRSPEWAKLREALRLMRASKVEIAQGRARVSPPGVRLDLGGIAKGDAAEQALGALRRQGIRSAAIQAGGDISLGDAPPGKAGWPVRLAGREEPAILRNCAISTSGDASQFVDLWGVRHSHVVDPQTGFGVTSRIEATVIAPRGLDSDPAATALTILGPDRAAPILKAVKGRAFFRVLGAE
jgi:thiamine biosynthesis lipoprotein